MFLQQGFSLCCTFTLFSRIMLAMDEDIFCYPWIFYLSVFNTVAILSLLWWIISWKMLVSVSVSSDTTRQLCWLFQTLAKWIFQSDDPQCLFQNLGDKFGHLMESLTLSMDSTLFSIRGSCIRSSARLEVRVIYWNISSVTSCVCIYISFFLYNSVFLCVS